MVMVILPFLPSEYYDGIWFSGVWFFPKVCFLFQELNWEGDSEALEILFSDLDTNNIIDANFRYW